MIQIVLILACLEATDAKTSEHKVHWQSPVKGAENIVSHSCIHDQILEQRRQPGRKVYTVTPQVYEASGVSKPLYRKGRALLGIPQQSDAKQPIRIYLNYDAVGHSPDRDCRNIGDIVKVSISIGSVSFGHILFLCCICDLGLVWFIIHLSICFFNQLGEPPVSSIPGSPSCNPHGDPPVSGDCWYNCTLDDRAGEDKRHRLRKVSLIILHFAVSLPQL